MSSATRDVGVFGATLGELVPVSLVMPTGRCLKLVEATPGIEPGYTVLQTVA